MGERRFGGRMRGTPAGVRADRDQARIGGHGAGRALLCGLAVVVFGWVVWAAGGVAYACDPVTGVGCDMTTPSTTPSTQATPNTAATPSSQPVPGQPFAPGSQRPSAPRAPAGEPFLPPGAQAPATPPSSTATPEQPGASVVPEPTQAPSTPGANEPDPAATSSGGGGGKWGWIAGALLLGGVGVGGLALAGRKSDPDAAAAEAMRQGAAAACADYQRSRDRADQLAVQEDGLRTRLAPLQDRAAQRHAYLENEARPHLIRNRFWSVWVGGPVASIIGGATTGVPETLGKSLTARTIAALGGEAGAAFGVAVFGAAALAIAGITWYNAPSVDQIDTALEKLHEQIEKELKPLQEELAQVKRSRDEASQARWKAHDRVAMLEGALQNHQPPIPFTPCGGA
jgi:hypothetical protein